MTPKEKAKELVEKMYEEIASYPDKSLCYHEWDKSKKIVSKAINQLLNKKILFEKEIEDLDSCDSILYWKRVLNAIKKT